MTPTARIVAAMAKPAVEAPFPVTMKPVPIGTLILIRLLKKIMMEPNKSTMPFGIPSAGILQL